MTKALQLTVTYYSRYASDVEAVLLLPLEANGLIIKNLEVGVMENEVYLGEIEGKHSVCYGDLHVEIIDLDELNAKAAAELLTASDVSSFEMYLEGEEMSFQEYLDNLEDEDERNELNKKRQALLDKYEVTDTYMLTGNISSKFVKSLSEIYAVKEINVNGDDYDVAVKLLQENGIEIL